jgi:hypothetical protein
MTNACPLPDNAGMSNPISTTRWTLVPKPAPAGGAIVKRYSLVPVEPPACVTGAAPTRPSS